MARLRTRGCGGAAGAACRGGTPPTFGAEVAIPAVAAVSGAAASFGAEVAPVTAAVRDAAAGRRAGATSGELTAPAGCAVRGTAAAFGAAGSFGTEVAAATSARRPRRVMAVQRFLHQPPQQLPLP